MKPHLFKKLRFIFLTLVIVSVCSASALAAEVRAAQTKASTLNLRESATTSSKILASAPQGSKLLVLDTKDGWCRVRYNGTNGYMNAEYLTMLDKADLKLGAGVITDDSVNFRKAPSTSAGILLQFDRNAKVEIVGVEGGWYKVTYSGKTGYVHPDYLTFAAPTPAVQAAAVQAAAPEGDDGAEGEADAEPPAAPQVDTTNDENAQLRADIVAYAQTFLGCKYRYGTMNGTTFDCSGFTSYVYKKFGYSLGRSAASQVSDGTKVDKADLLPGDIVLFRDASINRGAASHVGLYVGDGKFIHASSAGGCVKYSNLSDNYYARHYIGARRIV